MREPVCEYPQRPEGGFRKPEAGVLGSVDLGSLPQQQTLLTAELTLQLLKSSLDGSNISISLGSLFAISGFSWFSVIRTYLLACWSCFNLICRETFILKA